MNIRTIAIAAGGILLATLVRAAPETLPPHPTLLLAEYRGATHPVVAVEKEEPVILVEGRRKTLRGNIPLSTERLPRYAGAKAAITSVKIEGVQVVTAMTEFSAAEAAASPRGTLGGYVEFTGTITAEQDLADCYLALFAIDDDFIRGISDRPNAQIRVRQLPDLRAGQAAPVKFSTTPFLQKGKVQVFALLFAGGDEVSTDQNATAARYFLRREQVIHAATVKHWLEENHQGSRPVQPVLQIPPLFASTEGFPPAAVADLTVAADGTVLNVSLDRTFTPNAEATIRRTLGAWLFLPKIQDGVPSLTHVKVPLRF